jgi:hypothetical protein
MTVKEMHDLFNILYDNADQEAPGLNTYEVSQYLTKALYSIIRNTVEEFLKKGQSTGFRQDEINRYELTGLIKSANIVYPETVAPEDKTTPNSEFFKQPTDLYIILYEDVEMNSRNTMLNGRISLVQPTRYDYIQRILRNPFRRPNALKDVAYRLDKSLPDGTTLSEIIVDERCKPRNYRTRYIKSPYPIIIEDLDVAYPGMNLSIHGETQPYNDPTGNDEATNVNPLLHEKVVQRAVELAIRHYRENTLVNNIQTENI